MYCIKCGTHLSEGQTTCAICETKVYHPDFTIEEKPTYPKSKFNSEALNRKSIMFVITILFLLPLILPILIELDLSHSINWSGYVAGAVLLFYIVVVLPLWFKKANPVIFVPIDCAAAMLYILYIDIATSGHWFIPFAFPVCLTFSVIICTLITLLHYVKRSRLYSVGGSLIAFGLWTLLLELLIRKNFVVNTHIMWSITPLTVFSVLGLLCIIVAIVKPFKETLKRIFYIGKID